MESHFSRSLEFISKANRIGIHTIVTETPDKKGYLVHMDYDWFNTGENTREVTYIPKDGLGDWELSQNIGATLDFETAMALFNAKLLHIGRESLKNRKRDIILSQLSPEERQFLSPDEKYFLGI